MTEGIPPLEKRGPEAADEHTPAEWREKLRTLIKGEGEAELLGVGKMSERLRAHLAERSKELGEWLNGTPEHPAPDAPPIPEGATVSDVSSSPAEESAVAPDDSLLRDNEGNVVHDGEGNPVHTGTYETPPGTNEFGLTISVDEPHIYADSRDAHLFVYGGTPAEQAETIQTYLAAHPNGIIYGTDDTGTYRIPFHLLEGKVTAGLPVRTSGFLGFFSSWMKAPGPDEFAKIIK